MLVSELKRHNNSLAKQAGEVTGGLYNQDVQNAKEYTYYAPVHTTACGYVVTQGIFSPGKARDSRRKRAREEDAKDAEMAEEEERERKRLNRRVIDESFNQQAIQYQTPHHSLFRQTLTLINPIVTNTRVSTQPTTPNVGPPPGATRLSLPRHRGMHNGGLL
eukprot:812060-Prorocentrum_minimum.AAC.2